LNIHNFFFNSNFYCLFFSVALPRAGVRRKILNIDFSKDAAFQMESSTTSLSTRRKKPHQPAPEVLLQHYREPATQNQTRKD
jgi:hypothetical protein